MSFKRLVREYGKMTLDEVRVEIDKIDNEMKELFIKRMNCSRQVAEAKKEMNSRTIFIPEREMEILEKRGTSVDPEIYREYINFLKHTMSVSRRYQYGLMPELCDEVIEEAIDAMEDASYLKGTQLTITFVCDAKQSNLNQMIDMAGLNQIDILEMKMSKNGCEQHVQMTLEGNLKKKQMRQYIGQVSKETKDFCILEIK